MKKALITGITGQDGSYLAEFLLSKGYEVHGIVRKACAFTNTRLDWRKYVKVDPRYFRPTEVDELVANPIKVSRILGWNPKVKFHELVRIMVDANMRAVGLEPIGGGDKILIEKFPDRWWQVD